LRDKCHRRVDQLLKRLFCSQHDYRELDFPETVFEHIEDYREQQFVADHEAGTDARRGSAR
jgi:hypothetical protein